LVLYNVQAPDPIVLTQNCSLFGGNFSQCSEARDCVFSFDQSSQQACRRKQCSEISDAGLCSVLNCTWRSQFFQCQTPDTGKPCSSVSDGLEEKEKK
jgi:hypothetical protein